MNDPKVRSHSNGRDTDNESKRSRQIKHYYAKNKLTDFSRAMIELGMEVIYANSPQGKGRVENRNGTLQDRLVKAMRKRKISTITAANEFLKNEFTKEFNLKFGVNPEVPNVHKDVNGYLLEEIFCYKTTRQVRNDYTINLSGGYIQLLKGESPLPKPKQNGIQELKIAK